MGFAPEVVAQRFRPARTTEQERPVGAENAADVE